MTSFASTAQLRAFRPLGNNKTVNIVTTAANQNLVIPDSPFGTRSIRVFNSGAEVTFIEIGNSPLSASVTLSMPLPANSVSIFTFPNDATRIAVIGAAGGNTVYVTYGEGL